MVSKNNKAEAYIYSICLDVLFQEDFTATVVSVFNTSFNLQTGNRLIHISNGKNGINPFSICIYEEELRLIMDCLEIGDQVQFFKDKQYFLFPFQYKLFIRNSLQYNGKIEQENSLSLLKENKGYLMQYIVKNGENCLGLDLDWLGEEQFRLVDCLAGQKEDETRAVLDLWIGRGAGLTPSGDDIITGLSAIYCYSGKQRELKTLKAYIERFALQRTTLISSEYLYYASKGYFSSTIVNAVNALNADCISETDESLKALRKTGHTSGLDVLYGILLGISTLMDYNI